ncbi:MAG: cytochrome c [Candidatus Eremiobacteraeota bacterium]|nr:cytochrome c [Candidatus Eremiobacteraeota bacterium]
MFNKYVVAAMTAMTIALISAKPASAIPLFAQRYHLQCTACHSVLPELNAFGNVFRNNGYQLPIARHGTTLFAIRYQLEYDKTPAAGTRRYTPGGVLLSNADIGAVSAFLHYNLGAGGGPSGAYLAYLANYNEHTQALYRAGLFELPLAQSPGQRLDDLSAYGYYATRVGLNDLTLAAPRWGAQYQRSVGKLRADLTVALGEFKGAPYGGKPIATGEITAAGTPEVGLFLRQSLTDDTEVGGALLGGQRRITPTGRTGFMDSYRRYNVYAHTSYRKFDLQAEQWWGNDANADGFGTSQFSSGGYARLKYYPGPHGYLGIRYDGSANPLATRDIVYYGAALLTPHSRILLERRQPLGGGAGFFSAALTVGFPWPRGL